MNTPLHLTTKNMAILSPIIRFLKNWIRVFRVLKAKKCLRKYLKIRIYAKRVSRSQICNLFNIHYTEYPLHTLIPYEEIDNYLSEENREKYRRIEFWRKMGDEEEQVVCLPPTYYSGRYFTQYQIDDGAFVYSGRNVTCRFKGMDYCGLFGLGPRGHAYHSCIGWCGSRHDPENEKCYNVRDREAIMVIVLAIKRWIKKITYRKKRRIPIKRLYKELYDKYYHFKKIATYTASTASTVSPIPTPLQNGKLAIQVLFNSRFAKSHIMQFL